jgi:hypothetical protein
LVEEYGKRGFVVVGVTAEAEAPTQKFIDDNKFQAVVAIERSNKTMKEYGFKGYPSSALVGPDGKILWTGHPAGLQGKIIEEHLGSVRLRKGSGLAVFADLPKSMGSTANKLEKGRLGDGWKALKKAEADQKLGEDDRAMVTKALEDVEALAKGEIDKAETALGEGRYFDALESWEQLKKHFKGHPSADEAVAKIKDLKADKTKRDEIEAGRRIAKALAAAEAGKSKKAVQTLKTVTTGRLSTTEEATRARKLLEEM